MKHFLIRLKKLNKDQQPLWGKMSAHQVIEHLILAVQSSIGKINVECISDKDKLPVLKRFLLSEKPLPKGFNNPALKNLSNELMFPTIDEAINQLESEIEEYILFFENNPDALTVHVSFGKLNKKEWDVFHKKHFTYHLSQFGLM